MGKAEYNWVEIENRYVTGNESYRKLGTIFKVSGSQVFRVGKQNGWPAKRIQHRERVKANLLAQTEEAVALDKSQFDSKTHHIVDAVLASLDLHANKLIETLKAEEPKGISPTQATAILNVVRLGQEIKYRTLNIPAPTQRLEVLDVRAPAEETMDELQKMLESGKLSAFIPVEIAGGNGRGKRKGNGGINQPQ